jgi:hypothetical protein
MIIATRKTPIRIALAAALCLYLAFAANAHAAEPAPAWQLRLISYGSHFKPGTTGTGEDAPGYLLEVRNVGGAPTSGTITIKDSLPSSLSFSPAKKPFGFYGPFAMFSGLQELSCTTSAKTVSCSLSKPLPPQQDAVLSIPVSVPLVTPESVINEALVEGGGAPPVSTVLHTKVSADPASFGFEGPPNGAAGSATYADGSTATKAGSHPYQLSVGMNFNSFAPQEAGETLRVPGGGLRSVSGELPQGIVANPEATPKCTEEQLESLLVPGIPTCPNASQVGLVRVVLAIFGGHPSSIQVPLYNMVAPPGMPAEFGFEVIEGVYIHLLGRVRSDGDYGLSADVRNIPAKVGVVGSEVILWGDPSDPSFDTERGLCAAKGGSCPTEELDTAFVTLPSSCTTEPVDTFLHASNWIGEEAEVSYHSADLNGNPVGVDGCNELEFEPTIEAKPTTNLADSPSGLDFHLRQRQELKVAGRSTANLKNTTVSLPAGMALNPSAGNGLAGCTPEQLGTDGSKPAHCPDASKIGSVEVTTPLLENPLEGAVYLAQPFDNPFNSLLAIYIAVEDEMTGVVAKLPGKVTADPATGQLTTTVEESPELPLDDVALHLFTGPRAALTTPPACGEYTTTSDLTPWSTPEGADAHPTDTFATSVAPSGGTCPRNAGEAADKPAFSAGTISPRAGAYSPFVLKISREDGTQRIAGINTVLPEGLTGKLAGIPYCPESGIAQAMGRTHNGDGATEKANPSCLASSEVGTADVAAGSGITPLHVGAHAYLAGPYKGAPLSIVVITPAVAGPFDLGVVTTRVALHVDPETARIHAVSDPLPQIVEGIPLDVRSIALELGRPDFSLNPTSCNPMAVGGTVTSPLGGAAALSSPFQVGGCSALPFKPKLSITLKGGTKRGDFPALTATATAKPGEANIARVAVTLPHSAFLEQGHIGTVCTRVQFNQGSVPGEACPKRSIYGKATAVTPLLDQPLSGPVYLRSSTHQLPDLVVALHGQVDVVLAGKVDSVKGALRNTFEAVPDAPVSKFVLKMQGGRKGLIVNSRNLCAATNKATVLMDGQNGKVYDSSPVVKAKCGGKGRKGAKKGHKKG